MAFLRFMWRGAQIRAYFSCIQGRIHAKPGQDREPVVAGPFLRDLAVGDAIQVGCVEVELPARRGVILRWTDAPTVTPAGARRPLGCPGDGPWLCRGHGLGQDHVRPAPYVTYHVYWWGEGDPARRGPRHVTTGNVFTKLGITSRKDLR